MYIRIPVEIEVGSMVLVVLIDDVKNNNHYNLSGKWCEVIKFVKDKIQVSLLTHKFYIKLYNIDKFVFGGIIMDNPDFDIKRIIKK